MAPVAHLDELLKPENVHIVDHIASWEEAVHTSLEPLVQQGYAEPRYAENIIETTRELGPYWILTDDIALVHGRPEDGALRQQLAVTLVRDPVVFSDMSPSVRLLFALAAEDSDSHIAAIQMIAEVCMDTERLASLIQSATSQELYARLVESPSTTDRQTI